MCMCVSERRPSMPVLGYEGPRWWLQEIHWYRPGSFLSPYINSSSREEASRRIHIAYGISAFVYWDLNSCRRLDQDGVRGDRSIDAEYKEALVRDLLLLSCWPHYIPPKV